MGATGKAATRLLPRSRDYLDRKPSPRAIIRHERGARIGFTLP